jgi:DNA-directed RNA polymerase subunit alpha
MDQVSAETLNEIAQRDSWTIDDYNELRDVLFSMSDAVRKFRSVLADMEAASPDAEGTEALKIGIGRYLVCRFQDALDILTKATDNKERRFIAGECYRSMRHYAKAAEEYERAAGRGWDQNTCDALMAECLLLGGQREAADKKIKDILKTIGEESADGWYLRGLQAELDGRAAEALEAYENACELEGEHTRATFHLAYFLDLHGEEEEAIDLYQDCLAHPPVYASALLNLAVLYEDSGRYEQAEDVLQKLLSANPNNARARLFLRDVRASNNMYYDEDQVRRIAKRNAVLDIPVTDFELSVRARNCLKKMNIHTLGDLVRTSEAELLGYKNFGETSLKEIKEMLAAKGLRLGQAAEEPTDPFVYTSDSEEEESPQEQGARGIPVEQLDFSVRARRALEQLGVQTLGDLAIRSEAELMGQKNFGQTSLEEIRAKLIEHGLNFRESP